MVVRHASNLEPAIPMLLRKRNFRFAESRFGFVGEFVSVNFVRSDPFLIASLDLKILVVDAANLGLNLGCSISISFAVGLQESISLGRIQQF